VVIGLSESAAAEVDDYVIRILTICRGEIDMQMMSDAVNLSFTCVAKTMKCVNQDVARKIFDMMTKLAYPEMRNM
jgi:NAD(P)-dependent dehydrogenase (short-subunit alcohol dehydrogenase family)